MADTTIKLSGTYDSIEAYELLEEMRGVASDYLPLAGGEISGDLIVDGQLSADLTGNVTGTASGNLPLSGGTMTGEIKRSGNFAVGSADSSYINLYGGTAYDHGAWLQLAGKDHSETGRFVLQANDGTTRRSLVGKADGSFAWDGNNVLTSNMVVVETKTASATVNANDVATVNIDVSKTGYTAIGVVGFYPSGSYATFATFSHCYLSTSTNCYVVVRNWSTAQRTWSISVLVLYIKN